MDEVLKVGFEYEAKLPFPAKSSPRTKPPALAVCIQEDSTIGGESHVYSDVVVGKSEFDYVPRQRRERDTARGELDV